MQWRVGQSDFREKAPVPDAVACVQGGSWKGLAPAVQAETRCVEDVPLGQDATLLCVARVLIL